MAPKCGIANLYSSKYYGNGKNLKHDHYLKVFYKTNTYLPKTTSFEWFNPRVVV